MIAGRLLACDLIARARTVPKTLGSPFMMSHLTHAGAVLAVSNSTTLVWVLGCEGVGHHWIYPTLAQVLPHASTLTALQAEHMLEGWRRHPVAGINMTTVVNLRHYRSRFVLFYNSRLATFSLPNGDRGGHLIWPNATDVVRSAIETNTRVALLVLKRNITAAGLSRVRRFGGTDTQVKSTQELCEENLTPAMLDRLMAMHASLSLLHLDYDRMLSDPMLESLPFESALGLSAEEASRLATTLTRARKQPNAHTGHATVGPAKPEPATVPARNGSSSTH